jgi:hypothetical protein
MATIKELKRMCKSFKDNCDGCPLHSKMYNFCLMLTLERLPDNADEIVDKWVEEHPVKTYMQDFFEKFPNAPKDVDGAPKICPEQIYPEIDLKHRCYEKCSKCWNREMKTE